MTNHKNERLSEDIKREISAQMRELKDPRLTKTEGIVTIVRADVSGDNSHCKVYVSSSAGMDEAKTVCKGFESASGFLKREISNKMHLKKCPDLKFIPDDSIAHSAEINKILGDL